MIDIETGNLDEALWMNPGDVVPSLTLEDIEAMETDEFAGEFINDNNIAPQLNIQPTSTNTVVLSWSAEGFISFSIQTASSLDTTNWVTLTNEPTPIGATNQVILPVSAKHLYYRLVSQTP
jgi:hypothetical protein